jgi:tRNA(Ile)-lysidine synthase
MAQRVLSHIHRQELLRAGDRVGVAVSGGIDSVALLRLLMELRRELGLVLSVVHFNHNLRGAESDADEQFVANLARENHSDSDEVGQHAAEEHISVETAARDLRYGFFRYLLGEDSADEPNTLQKLDKVATGHTLDDQAETVLMRLIRGAGLRGLGGIHPQLTVEDGRGEVSGEIIRPLLAVRRRELEQYLNDIRQPWREDSTNADDRFTRNRVRNLVVPLLEKKFNPSVAETLAELSEIARGEEDYWENEISGWLGTTVQWTESDWAPEGGDEVSLVQIDLPGHQSKRSSPLDPNLQSRIDNSPWLVVNASVSRMWFLAEPVAVQRRLVKAIGERVRIPLEFKHVEEILRFAAEDGASGKELSLPLGWKLVREPDELIFLTPDLREPAQPQDYEYELPIPGQIVLDQATSQIEARRIPAGANEGYNSDQLLDPESLPGPLRVRNWRPGDRFWPARTKSPKKIKELLQERHVAQPERRLWPVVVSGEEIVWLRGFPSPARVRAKPGREAILILEKSLAAKATKQKP